MFPFRPSRAAAALLELADALLAPQEAFEAPRGDDDGSVAARAATHPHRRAPSIERRRRPAPPRPVQPCIAPTPRALRPSDEPRRTDAPTRS
jgi:hypothetical protein